MNQRKMIGSVLLLLFLLRLGFAAENELTSEEKATGWVLLFDGKTTTGWLDSKELPIPETLDQRRSQRH